MANTPLSDDARVKELERRMANLEDRIDALNTKIDVTTEAVRGDIKLVLERVDSLGTEMRREFATVRREHHADHQLLFSILKDHGMRLRFLEGEAHTESGDKT
jgi:uncharacterized coiled-coil protein SlyX